MTFFNDLSNGVYPSLFVTFNDGTHKMIKEVTTYTPFTTCAGEYLRIYTKGAGDDPIELKDVKKAYSTFYEYKE